MIEQQALANEWLSKPESCLPWEPIPSRFSRAPWVTVTHVAEDYGNDNQSSGNLTIALAAHYATVTPGDVGAWRIDFTGCETYRARYIGVAGAAPLTRPEELSALWEISGSHYLVESGVWASHKDYLRHAYHHYVILNATFFVHEVIALSWRCSPLPPAWANVDPHALVTPPWPPQES